jgi:hypothetical protein
MELDLESGNTLSYQQSILASQRGHERQIRALTDQRTESNQRVVALEAQVRTLMQLIIEQGELIEQLKDILLTDVDHEAFEWVSGAAAEVDDMTRDLPDFDAVADHNDEGQDE